MPIHSTRSAVIVDMSLGTTPLGSFKLMGLALPSASPGHYPNKKTGLK
jgi:hypothetical protein